ncbi:MAG: hypothetical protein PHS96_06585 [Anaerolineales bacterium]|nr:hypothetical protein [Anaerolineales bacterium]
MAIPQRIARALLSALVITLLLSGNVQTAFAEYPTPGTNACRFGITAPYAIDGYDLSRIGVGSLLTWLNSQPASLPSTIEHTKVLRVSDAAYPSTLSTITTTVITQPGNPEAVYVWNIGNEPDASLQDNISDKVYAERYFQLATIIRGLDTNDLLGFGSIVQPTPLRLYYLTKVMHYLKELAGNEANVLALIDLYTPHAFLLNEKPLEWGSQIPTFHEPDDPLIPDGWVITYDFDRTHDINYFKQYVREFRKWMMDPFGVEGDLGDRNKEVWITEYGSLLTPIPPPGVPPQSWNVSDEVTRDYMLATFDFLFGAEGISTTVGLPEDGNRLVQRAYWYSLNEYRWIFGGSLFDPLNKQLTPVGRGFIDYNPSLLLDPPSLVDVHVISDTAKIVPVAYTPGSGKTLVNYQAEVSIGNNSMSNLLTNVLVQLEVYNSQSVLYETVSSGPLALPRCGGRGTIKLQWNSVPPSVSYDLLFKVDLQPYDVETDPDASNDLYYFSYTGGVPKEVFLPLVLR